MNKKTGICMLAGCGAACLILSVSILIGRLSHKPEIKVEPSPAEVPMSEPQQSVPLSESMTVVPPAAYYIGELDGYLVVLGSNQKTVLFETNIRYEFLSDEMKEKVKTGISFQNERDLYEFLENYST